MARIRSVKPGYFRSPEVATLSHRARLFFVGLWTACDDDGRVLEDLRLLKADLWPLDDDVTVDEIEEDLRDLEKHDRLTRYTVRGRRYLQVHNFRDHQKPNKPIPSKLPSPDEADPTPVALPEHDGSPPVALLSVVEGLGEEGLGGGKNLRDEPRELPTKADPDRTLADTIAEWLALQGVDLAPPERLSDRFGELVEVITDGAKRPTEITRGVQKLCGEYVEATTGQPLPHEGWGHLGRLITEHGPRKAFRGVVEAVVNGAGIDPPHDLDARALTKYATSVLAEKPRPPPGSVKAA